MARDLARRVAWGILGAAAVAAAGAGARVEQHAIATDLATERDLHGAAHAGSDACRGCHEEHYQSWHRTFHRTMTQAASPGNAAAVLGDFSGDAQRAVLRQDGVVARMDRDAAGAFRMTFTSQRDPARAPVSVVVSRAIGSRRYQQYLTRIGDEEYRLPVAWHVEEQRWFHMNGAFLFADAADAAGERGPLSQPLPGGPGRGENQGEGGRVPGARAGSGVANDAGAGSGARSVPSAPPTISPSPPSAGERIEERGPQPRANAVTAALDALGAPEYARHVTRWNDNCVFCHNVAPNPARDALTGRFQTAVAEMGVACEACHGPGAAHARANADPVRRYALHLGGGADPTIVNPSRLSPARSADLCGRCHGQRITDDIGSFMAHGDPFVPGDDLALWSAPLWQGTSMGDDPAPFAPRFWPDGTARLTAYEYQGLLQSPCTQRGPLTCTSCHGMHDGDPRGQLRPTAIGSAGDAACTGCHVQLATPAATVAHSHHKPRAGTRCVDCHMPRIVYGVLDIHRSHRIEVPDPTRDAAAGRPDACITCHVDEIRVWAPMAFETLWGRAQDITAVMGAADSPGVLPYGTTVLSGDPIERAVAADALGRAPVLDGKPARAARAGLLVEVMIDDEYPAVRHLAARALGRLLPALQPALAGYDPGAPADARHVSVERVLRAVPDDAIVAPDPDLVRRQRTAAQVVAIEIGE